MNLFNKFFAISLTTIGLLNIDGIINTVPVKSESIGIYNSLNTNSEIHKRISNYYNSQGYKVRNISQDGTYSQNGFVIYQYTVFLTRNGQSYTQALNSYTANNRVYATIFQNDTQNWTNWFLI